MHQAAIALAEDRLGRPLTRGERHLDLVGLDRDLEAYKRILAAQIDREKRRALRAHFERRSTINLRLTGPMAATIRNLYLTGRKHAREEIKRMTRVVLAERDYAAEVGPGYDRALTKLGAHLQQFQARVQHGAAAVDIGGAAGTAVIARALRVPGALNVASQVVSTGLLAGIGDVYAAETGLFTSFVYSAVMDSGTCDVCAPLDGTIYESWEAIMEVLPDGGPNPDCEGGDRCRCRAVPGDVAGLPPQVQEDLAKAAQFPNIKDEADANYRGIHTAPTPETGAPLYDLTGAGTPNEIYPADVYDKSTQVQYYGSGPFSKQADQESFAVINAVHNQPDAMVTIYRAMPKLPDGTLLPINPGDWVTTSKSYAQLHLVGQGDKDWAIVAKRVPAKEVWTDGNSINEYGWMPSEEPKLPAQVEQDLLKGRAQRGIVDEASPAEIAGLTDRQALDGLLPQEAQDTANLLDAAFENTSYTDAEREIYAWYRAPADFEKFEGQLRKGRMTGTISHLDSNLRPAGYDFRGGEVTQYGFASDAELQRFGIKFTRKSVRAVDPSRQMHIGMGQSIPLKPLIDTMDKMIADSPALPQEITLYRGTQTLERIFGPDGPTVGESYVERGYMSLSANPTVAELFSEGMSGFRPGEGGKAFMEVKVPKGTKGVWARADGQDQIYEFTLPRHSKLVVDRIDHVILPQSDYIPGGPQTRIYAHIEMPVADPADIGITPFRAGIDDPEGFYQSQRFHAFENDVQRSADYYGVTVQDQKMVTGVWEGQTEPSVSLVVKDSVDGVRAYSANLGQAYGQDGVLVFNDQSFESAMITFDKGPVQDEVILAMKDLGISGGRFTADGELQIIGSGEEFVRQAHALASRLGVKYRAETGHFALIEKDNYATALRTFDGQGATARPGLPLSEAGAGKSGMATALGEGGQRGDVIAANAARQADLLAQATALPPAAAPNMIATSIEDVIARNPGVQMIASERPEGLVLSMIKIDPSAQGEGAAGKAMRDLIDYADSKRLPLVLTPEQVAPGMSKTKLEAWYRRLGFVKNTGTKADFRFTESFIRPAITTPIVDNVDVAAEMIRQGMKVELRRPEEVATMLDRMAAIAKDAQTRGAEAPVYDLGEATVQGTNLFTKDSLGIPRVKMPQLKGVPVPGSKADKLPRDKHGNVDITPQFYESLKAQGIAVREEDVPVAYLKATQDELNGSEVGGIMDFMAGGGKIDGRITVSRDNYIVDGHHRWAGEIGLDYKNGSDAGMTIAVDRIDQPIAQILDEANRYAKEWGVPPVSVSVAPDVSATKAAIVKHAVEPPIDAARQAGLAQLASDLEKARRFPEIVDDMTPAEAQRVVDRPSARAITHSEATDPVVRHAAAVFHTRQHDLMGLEDLAVYRDPQTLGVRWAETEIRKLTKKSLNEEIQFAAERLNKAKDALDHARLAHTLVVQGMSPQQAAIEAANTQFNPVPTPFLPSADLIPTPGDPAAVLAATPGLQASVVQTPQVIEITSMQLVSYGDNVRQLGSGYSPQEIVFAALDEIIRYADQTDRAIAITPIETVYMTASEMTDWLISRGFGANDGSFPGVTEAYLRQPLNPAK